MSGHSKWAKIKRQKGVNDTKRGNLFTKLAKNITLASKEGGGDQTMNFALRLAVDKAKVANMPSDNIQRAIDRGIGKNTEGNTFQRVSYEALGPAGTVVIIDCQTDNTNRTVAEVRNIIESSGGKFATVGSVSWQFSEKGLVVVGLAKLRTSKVFGKGLERVKMNIEDIETEILEIEGIEDMNEIIWDIEGSDTQAIELVTPKSNFSQVVKELENRDFEVLNAELVKVASEKVQVDNTSLIEKIENFISQLEDHDDVDSVWVNY